MEPSHDRGQGKTRSYHRTGIHDLVFKGSWRVYCSSIQAAVGVPARKPGILGLGCSHKTSLTSDQQKFVFLLHDLEASACHTIFSPPDETPGSPEPFHLQS